MKKDKPTKRKKNNGTKKAAKPSRVKKSVLKKGVPESGTPLYYFVRNFSKGKWIYKDKKGNEVTEEKVKRSKRKVFYSNAKGEIIQKQERPKSSGIKVKNKKGKKELLKGGKKLDSATISTSIFGFDVISKVSYNAENNRENFFKINGKTYQFGKSKAPIFCLVFAEIHAEFLTAFLKVLPSPILLIGYIEFSKNSIFDFDDIDINIGGGEYEGLNSEDLAEEEIGGEIIRTMKIFRSFVKRKIKEYFSINI